MTWVLDNLDLIWSLTLDHVRQSVIAIALGFVIALPIGWAAWRYTILRGPVLTAIGLLYTIPSLGLFALLAALGVPYLSETNLIIALTIYGVAIMTRSVTDGLDSVDPATRSAAIAVGFGPWRRFWTVDLPLSGPVLLAGLRVTATSTIALAPASTPPSPNSSPSATPCASSASSESPAPLTPCGTPSPSSTPTS